MKAESMVKRTWIFARNPEQRDTSTNGYVLHWLFRKALPRQWFEFRQNGNPGQRQGADDRLNSLRSRHKTLLFRRRNVYYRRQLCRSDATCRRQLSP
jgi:hypothetical protein